MLLTVLACLVDKLTTKQHIGIDVGQCYAHTDND